MTKLRYFLRLVLAYIKRFKVIIFSSIFLGVGGFFSVKIITTYFIIPTERIGVTGRFHSENLPSSILHLISSGLTKIDDENTVAPSLSESWETPDKGKTWIFYLKDNIYWQDGTKLNSFDIVYEFSDVEIERPDDMTIIFKLQDSFSPFPSLVSKPTFKQGLLGVGEWKVKKLVFNGNFISELVLQKQKDAVKIFKFYPTTDRTKLAYKFGEVDKIYDLIDPTPFDEWKTAISDGKVYKNHVVTLFFNTEDELLSEKTFRQALTYAIDKNKFGQRAISPITDDSWAFNPQIKEYKYNIEKSKDLINDLPSKFQKELTIKLVSSPNLLPVAEEIANDWKNVGVETQVQVSSIIPYEFQVFLSIYDISPDPDQYSIWHSTRTSTNISKYKSPRVDKLLEDGRTELDFVERKKIYLDFQRFLLEDLPAAFLYHPTYYTISRK